MGQITRRVEVARTPTSETGSNFASCGMTPFDPIRVRAGGFTLLELVVALSIAAIALLIIPGSATALRDSMQYRAAVSDVLGALRDTRIHAMKTGRDAVLTIDLESRRIEVSSVSRSLPDSIEIGFIVADREREATRGSIRFYPDGSSTGGSIVLRRQSGDGVRLRVDWLIGRVTQEPLRS